jgi:hypothetical protein
MKKYTIEEFKQGKKAVWITNKADWAKLNKILSLNTLGLFPRYFTSTMLWENDKKECEDEGYECLDFSQLVFEEEFPENWCIKITEANRAVLQEHFDLINCDVREQWKDLGVGFYLSIPYDGSYQDWSSSGHNSKANGCIEISDSQFKEHVLKQPKMGKEIIGWKLIQEQYKEVALKLATISGTDWAFSSKKDGYNFCCNSTVHDRLKEAGVMHWFEPVYREDKKLPVINGKEGTYKKGDECVVYGDNCAKISTYLLKMVNNANYENHTGSNRLLKSITLYSGVSITMDQIGEILDYVKFVNEQ